MRFPISCCFLLIFVGGCADLLGIEEATCDPKAPACAGQDSVGLSEAEEESNDDRRLSPCEAFCEDAERTCTDELSAYTSSVVCLNVCALYRASELECRLGELERARDLSEPETHCPAASIAGTRNDASEGCDTACGSYCKMLAVTCPDSFDPDADNPQGFAVYDDIDECEASCRDDVTEAPRGLSVRDRTGDTLQCRLWHLAQSTVDPVHCSHARGDCPCGEEEACEAVLDQ